MLPSDPLTAARILIVDDEHTNVRLLEGILRRDGYTNVTSTTDPRLVARLYADFEPDLILLDLMMPRMDGFQVMSELRKGLAEGSYLPILVLTADMTSDARNMALSMGANDFLTKPLDQHEVTLRIRNLLETRSLYLRLRQQQSILEEKVAERTKELRHSLDVLERTAEEQSKMLARLNAAQTT
ncbi:MAG: response regulator [Actinomycetota bacterium]|nr:response regulator [Actinomycetota bacterium]